MRYGSEQNYKVLSVYIFYEMLRNGIPRFLTFLAKAPNEIVSVFRFREIMEFRRNE